MSLSSEIFVLTMRKVFLVISSVSEVGTIGGDLFSLNASVAISDIENRAPVFVFVFAFVFVFVLTVRKCCYFRY